MVFEGKFVAGSGAILHAGGQVQTCGTSVHGPVVVTVVCTRVCEAGSRSDISILKASNSSRNSDDREVELLVETLTYRHCYAFRHLNSVEVV